MVGFPHVFVAYYRPRSLSAAIHANLQRHARQRHHIVAFGRVRIHGGYAVLVSVVSRPPSTHLRGRRLLVLLVPDIAGCAGAAVLVKA